MAGRSRISFYSSHSTVIYTPSTILDGRSDIPRFPTPPCAPRERRPHCIRITRLQASPLALANEPGSVKPLNKTAKFRVIIRKLASRENAKRLFGTVFSSFSSSSTAAPPSVADSSSSAQQSVTPRSSISVPRTASTLTGSRIDETVGNLRDRRMSRPRLADSSSALGANNPSAASLASSKSAITSVVQDCDKPVAAGNGVSVSIILAEPTVYLAGLDHDGSSQNSATNGAGILRGKLRIDVTKSTKIKAITLKFTGRARTEWPEGIPPEKTQTYEEDSLRNEVLPFFNAMFDGSDSGYGALCTYTLRQRSASSSVTNLSSTALDLPSSPSQQSGFSIPMISNRTSRSSTALSAKDQKRLSLQSIQSRSFQKGESPFGPTPQQKGYKVFHPGLYEYSFELPIDNNSPETTKLGLASVTWMLEALVERAGTFRANLQGFKEVPVVRSPSEDSLELVEPISISRKWEDQLHYEIMISGKSFPLGSKIPIAFKLTPLAKVQVHKLKVYVSENIDYFTSNRKVTRKDVTRKILLFEKSAGKDLSGDYNGCDIRTKSGGEPKSQQEREELRQAARRRRQWEAKRTGTEPQELPEPTDNILGDLDLGLEQLWGSTEIEMNVQLPTCETMEKDRTKRMHHDCTWKNVNVHHWIKIVMRISRADTSDPTGKKRRHFEISIDSPFTVLNCRATQANLALPEYSGLNPSFQSRQHVCGCPNAATTTISPASSSGDVPTLDSLEDPQESNLSHPETAAANLTRPPRAHLSINAAAGVQRPIHMLRNPSYNPPAFDEDEPPPPLATPPPLYDHIIGTPSHDGLADYFARLSETYDDDASTDDEDIHRAVSRGRVNVVNPRTPGGRIARSMEIDRNFMFNPVSFNQTLSRETGGERRLSATGGS